MDRNNDLYQEKLQYIDEIRDICDTVTGPPLNVALIGCVGVGKSTFVNTIAAALSVVKWQEFAYCGMRGFSGDPVTNFPLRYPRCCQRLGIGHDKLPTLFDIAGFPEQMDPTWEKVLQMLFYGTIPEGKNLKQVYDYLEDKKKDAFCLPKYNITYSHLKIDKVIFVCSANEETPEHLIESVMRAARPLEGPAERSIPIFCVMTKADCVDLVKDEKVIRRRNDIIGRLGLQGSEHRFLACTNYCGYIDSNNERLRRTFPELDVPVLKFLTQVCEPVIKVVHTDKNYPSIFIMKDYFFPVIVLVIAVVSFLSLMFLMNRPFRIT